MFFKLLAVVSPPGPSNAADSGFDTLYRHHHGLYLRTFKGDLCGPNFVLGFKTGIHIAYMSVEVFTIRGNGRCVKICRYCFSF